ncbi:MAG: hypothetical protein EOP84_18585 [Verrucomicrobiaceae bacterium]|nr:MAG: hypothetical protein EOP84_18585 [Verrucomicrobiaceae bacterium]
MFSLPFVAPHCFSTGNSARNLMSSEPLPRGACSSRGENAVRLLLSILGGILLPFITLLTTACGEREQSFRHAERYEAAQRERRTMVVGGREIQYEVADREVVTEGDITWGTEEEFKARMALRTGTLGTFNYDRSWTMPIKYSFDNQMPDYARNAILNAMSRLVLESGAKISFETCSTCLSAHIKFVYNGNGCSSPVGRQSFINKINIDTWCDEDSESGSIMHEIMHSLGLNHEQSRCDRNNYVVIDFGSIPDDEEHNFTQECGNTDWGPYDYSSVMHYSPYAFSNNGQKTITAHDPSMNALMGQRAALSDGDIRSLRAVYGTLSGGGGGGCGPDICIEPL